ncbi:MAG: site-specific DNA-methyltransferase [Tannerella sp.]|jgi:DNA modification methylase|nr:site-specific DNA-methyltransferase [Tannerella sp.]
MQTKEFLFEQVNPGLHIEIQNEDCLSALKRAKDNTFDLVLTSPPYNVGKSYETKVSIEKYLETQEEIISELVRILSNRGNLCWQTGNFVDKGEVFPLDIYCYRIFNYK